MRRHLPLILTLAAVAVAVSILGWQVWLTVRPDPVRSPRTNTQRGVGDDETQTRPAARPARVVQVRPERDPNPEVLRSLDDPEPVEVELMAVVQYEAPLHANAPGRMPAKEGERKTGSATLPPDPVAYAASLPDIDPALLAWLRRWEAAVLAHGPLPGKDDRAPLEGTRLRPRQLYEIGRGIRFVQSNDKGGLSFYKAAVIRAAEGLQHATADSLTREQQGDRYALRMMARPLWHAGDYATSITLFQTLTHVEPADSFAAYRARFLWAECYYELGRPSEKRELYEEAWAIYKPLIKHPPSHLSEAELGELHWAAGAVLYGLGRYTESAEQLVYAAEVKRQPYSETAKVHRVWALAWSGQRDEAFALLDEPGWSDTAKERVLANMPLGRDLRSKRTSEPDQE